MANGTTRNALSQMQLNKSGADKETNEEMAILQRGHGEKISLKNPSEHNHSTNTLRSKKGGL